jgi:hypothetical protein
MELSPTSLITKFATGFSHQATDMDMATIFTDTTSKLMDITKSNMQITVIPIIKLMVNPTDITQNTIQPTEIHTIKPTEKNTVTE